MQAEQTALIGDMKRAPISSAAVAGARRRTWPSNLASWSHCVASVLVWVGNGGPIDLAPVYFHNRAAKEEKERWGGVGGQPCDNYDCSDCKKLRLPTLCLKFYFQTVCISGMRVGALFPLESWIFFIGSLLSFQMRADDELIIWECSWSFCSAERPNDKLRLFHLNCWQSWLHLVFFDTQQVNRVLATPLVSSVSNTGCLLQSDPLMFVTFTLREEAAKTWANDKLE